MWSLVSEKKECNGEEVFGGKFATLEACANRCLMVSSMFAFGTNDFTDDQTYHRCFQDGCNCLCETQATNYATCETVNHLGYRLYKYSDHVEGNLQTNDINSKFDLIKNESITLQNLSDYCFYS